MSKIKYTVLPPQATPKGLTAHRRPPNLGEHQLAFLNSNNRYGFQVDEIPEEPIVDEMAALFLTVLYNLPKLSRFERQQEMAKHHRKMLSAGYAMQGGVYVKVKTLTEEDYARARQAKHGLIKRNQLQQMLVRPSVLQEFEAAKRDPRWQQPWNHAEYHEALSRKHIYATRTFEPTAAKLHAKEHQTRLDKLLDELDQQSNIKNPILRRLVSLEKAACVLASNEFVATFDIDEFLNAPITPKSEPTGHHRINPYLDN
jgi:hypothetical protein